MALIAVNRVIESITLHRKEPPGTIIAESILQKRIDRNHRQIKQRVRVRQTFQVLWNAQVMKAGIEFTYQFRQEKGRRLTKIQDRGVPENLWLMLLAARAGNQFRGIPLSSSDCLHHFRKNMLRSNA